MPFINSCNSGSYHSLYILYIIRRNGVFPKLIIITERVEATENTAYIFEPDAETILSALLPKYLNVEIYQALLNNTASEHSARKNSMKNATDNAEEMMTELNLKYNRERQSAITQEITEIVGGASALN